MIKTETMAMAQEAGLGRYFPAEGLLPAEWFGDSIDRLEKFEELVIERYRERVSMAAGQRKAGGGS